MLWRTLGLTRRISMRGFILISFVELMRIPDLAGINQAQDSRGLCGGTGCRVDSIGLYFRGRSRAIGSRICARARNRIQLVPDIAPALGFEEWPLCGEATLHPIRHRPCRLAVVQGERGDRVSCLKCRHPGVVAL